MRQVAGRPAGRPPGKQSSYVMAICNKRERFRRDATRYRRSVSRCNVPPLADSAAVVVVV